MIERERKHYADRGWGQWAAVERATGRMVGVCGLILWPNIGGKEALEVAYLFAKPYWGKVYATASGRFSAGKVSVSGCHSDRDEFKRAFKKVSKKSVRFV